MVGWQLEGEDAGVVVDIRVVVDFEEPVVVAVDLEGECVALVVRSPIGAQRSRSVLVPADLGGAARDSGRFRHAFNFDLHLKVVVEGAVRGAHGDLVLVVGGAGVDRGFVVGWGCKAELAIAVEGEVEPIRTLERPVKGVVVVVLVRGVEVEEDPFEVLLDGATWISRSGDLRSVVHILNGDRYEDGVIDRRVLIAVDVLLVTDHHGDRAAGRSLMVEVGVDHELPGCRLDVEDEVVGFRKRVVEGIALGVTRYHG